MPTTATKSNPLLAALGKHGACTEAIEWAKAAGHKTKAAAWLACNNPEWLLWALDAIGYKNDSKLRKIACWCARNTPLPDGRITWDLLTDERSRKAIEVAEAFADGKAIPEELAAARAAACAAARAAACAAACAAAWDAAWDAASAAAWDAAWDAQCNAIREIVGNPFAKQRRPRA